MAMSPATLQRCRRMWIEKIDENQCLIVVTDPRLNREVERHKMKEVPDCERIKRAWITKHRIPSELVHDARNLDEGVYYKRKVVNGICPECGAKLTLGDGDKRLCSQNCGFSMVISSEEVDYVVVTPKSAVGNSAVSDFEGMDSLDSVEGYPEEKKEADSGGDETAGENPSGSGSDDNSGEDSGTHEGGVQSSE